MDASLVPTSGNGFGNPSFVYDTYLLKMLSRGLLLLWKWTMELDTDDKDEGNLFFPTLKQSSNAIYCGRLILFLFKRLDFGCQSTLPRLHWNLSSRCASVEVSRESHHWTKFIVWSSITWIQSGNQVPRHQGNEKGASSWCWNCWSDWCQWKLKMYLGNAHFLLQFKSVNYQDGR